MIRVEERFTAMCGRFTLFDADPVLSKGFGVSIGFALPPRYNIAPSQQILAVRPSTGNKEREAVLLRWGLIPHWAKDPSIGNRLINARAETVAEKPAFREAYKHRRCIIPTSGFYEWKRDGKSKRPYFIRLKDRHPFAFAGIWERWEKAPGEAVESCAILTMTPNSLMAELHDRMPMILWPSDYCLWLDTGTFFKDQLVRNVQPFPDREMEAFPVGTIVNNPKMEDPRCIIPVDSSPGESRG